MSFSRRATRIGCKGTILQPIRQIYFLLFAIKWNILTFCSSFDLNVSRRDCPDSGMASGGDSHPGLRRRC